MVKSIVLSVIFFTVCAVFFTGQGNEPLLLKSPRDWKFERIDFPPGFAPDLDYKGFEELRFGPGMFDKKAEFYFSYVFAIVLKNTGSSEVDLIDFLYKYYKGLITVVAQQKKMSVDLSQIKVKARKRKPAAGRRKRKRNAASTESSNGCMRVASIRSRPTTAPRRRCCTGRCVTWR